LKHEKLIRRSNRLLWLLILTAGIFFTCPAFGIEDLNEVITSLNKPWTGDFDQMVQKRSIRVLIPYSKTFYFLDRGTQRGATYEMVQQFEKSINTELKTRHLKLQVLFIPTPRGKLISNLANYLKH